MNILITGASVGIGRETAYHFAEENNLIITYNSGKKDIETTKRECMNRGAESVTVLKLDVRSSASIKKAFSTVKRKFKSIDILINNAGVIQWKPLKKQTGKEIEDQVRTNLEGLIKVTKTFLPIIKDTIINISSGAGKTGYADLTTYCATKFGVRGFTQALAQESKLNIYSVNPGMTKTRMTGFKGVPVGAVAEVIYKTAMGKFRVKSGGDVDVWNHISPLMWKRYADVN